MRILKIGRRSRAYWTELYATRPDAAGLGFDAQRAWFCADFFGPVDTWEFYLRRAGHDAIDLIAGIEPLDAAWLAERGGSETGFALTLRQAAELDPEVLVLEAIQSFTVAEIAALRARLPRLKAIVGMTGFDLRNRPELAAVDVVVTCMPNLVAHVRREGGKALHLPFWFDRRVLERLPPERRIEHELTFVGNLDPGPHAHDDRRTLLRRMAGQVDIAIYSNLETRLGPVLTRYVATKAAYELARLTDRVGFDAGTSPVGAIRKAATWSKSPVLAYDRQLSARVRPSAYGMRMYEILRRGRSTLNVHIALAERYAANMRLFEATGAGVCLLTDWKENLGDFFTEDEVVSYRTIGEATEKARWLIDHPDEADAIATRGQKRTLTAHGFDQRVPLIEAAIALACG